VDAIVNSANEHMAPRYITSDDVLLCDEMLFLTPTHDDCYLE